MSVSDEILPLKEVRAPRGAELVRVLNQVLPLGRKYNLLVRLLNGQRGLLAVPFGVHHAIEPAAWSKTIATLLTLDCDVVPEFRVLGPLCRELSAGHLIDVGANVGLFTLALRTASSLPIIAYEPQPFLSKLLRSNVAYNRLAGVELRMVACGAGRGEIAFSTGLNGSVVLQTDAAKAPPAGQSGGSGDLEAEAKSAQVGGVVKVPVVTLDEDLAHLEKIALLKIDCEGYEFEILRGAQKLLQRHRPLLFVEVHPEQLVQFGHSTQQLLDFLAPDYDLEFWYFQIGRHASKWSRSLEKFRRPHPHRCASVSEMLAVSTSVPGPAQIYFIGRPKKLFSPTR